MIRLSTWELLPTMRRSVSGNCLKSFLKSSLRCLYVGLRTCKTHKAVGEENTHTHTSKNQRERAIPLSHSWSSVKCWFSFAMQQRERWEMNYNEFIPTASHSQTHSCCLNVLLNVHQASVTAKFEQPLKTNALRKHKTIISTLISRGLKINCVKWWFLTCDTLLPWKWEKTITNFWELP